MRLITAASAVSRNSRGRGLPDCGRGVTVPVSTKPNPRRISAGTATASLSNPAARPIGLANRRPSTSTARHAASVSRDRPARPRRRAVKARRCARSGSTRRTSGMKADAIAGVMSEDGYACRRTATIAGSRGLPRSVDPCSELGVAVGTCCPGVFGLSRRALCRKRPCAELLDSARPAWRRGHWHALLTTLGAGLRVGRLMRR